MNENSKKIKIGIIGGNKGLGNFFKKIIFKKCKKDFEVYFSSRTKYESDKSYISNNIELVKKCEIIILAVNLLNIKKVFEEIFPYLENKSLIEIASVKKFMIDTYQNLKTECENNQNKINFEFISLHPMFGESTITLLNKNFIEVFYNNDLKTSNYKKLKSFFIKEKVNYSKLKYIEHDKLMALIQGLNHTTIFLNSKLIGDSEFPIKKFYEFSSPNYEIFLIIFNRYMKQNTRLYFEIQIKNEFILPIIEKKIKELSKFKEIIVEKNFEKWETFFSNSKEKIISFDKNNKIYEKSEDIIEFISKN